MRVFTIIFFISAFLSASFSQEFAGGMNYQAVALDAEGREMAEKTLVVRFSIREDTGSGNAPLYQETQQVQTDLRGLFSVVIGNGNVTGESLSESIVEIDWHTEVLYLSVETEADNDGGFRLAGIQQMMSVPFAMHAASAASYSMLSGSNSDPEEPVFQVKNSEGQVVFAVYQNGVEMIIDEQGKGSRAGFAVGGFSASKDGGYMEYLRVDPGMVQVTVDDDQDEKGTRGGFAVGGFSSRKSGMPDYLLITPSLAEIYLDSGMTKGARSGFAVGGFSSQKGDDATDYLAVSHDSIIIFIDDNPDGKGSRGGFAVGGFQSAKTGGSDFLTVEPGYARFAIDHPGDDKGSRAGFAVGGFSSHKGTGKDYLTLTPSDALFRYDLDLAKGSRAGFAVGGFSSQKSGAVTDLLIVTADSTRVGIPSSPAKGARAGFAVGGMTKSKGEMQDIFYADAGMTRVYTQDGGTKLTGGFTVFSFDPLADIDLFRVTRQVTRVTTLFSVVPTVSTGDVEEITTVSATVGGEVLDDGNSEVTQRGFVWSTSPRPGVSNNEGIYTEEGGSGSFTGELTGLDPGRRYYVRAFAINMAGSGYGEQAEFYTNNIITAVAGENGSIEPSGDVVLERDETRVFTITPDQGYEIANVTLGGLSVLADLVRDGGTGTYSLVNNFTGVRELVATFSIPDDSVIDADGNVYSTVMIGGRRWMAENLKTTRFRNNDEIPLSEDPFDFNVEFEMPQYIVYDPSGIDGVETEEEMISHYGILYNSAAVMDDRGICPAGWYVPGLNDYDDLINAYGGPEIAGSALRSARTAPDDTHPRWNEESGATGESGFEGLPGGKISYNMFEGLGETGYWWTSSSAAEFYAFFEGTKKGGEEPGKPEDDETKDTMEEMEIAYMALGLSEPDVFLELDWEYSGMSVRCIYGQGVPRLRDSRVTSLTTTSATVTGFVIDDGDMTITAAGVAWGDSPDPGTGDNVVSATPGFGQIEVNIEGLEPNTVYYARPFATTFQGTGYGNTVMFTTYNDIITDIDGNQYYTVMVGDTEWMAENLKVTRYDNGDIISTGLDDAQWQNTVTGAYAVFDYEYYNAEGINSDEEMVGAYGLLYNWFAVSDPRGVCPAGWTMPADDDFSELLSYVGGFEDAGKLVSMRTDPDTHPRWDAPNRSTNETGFSALPGAYRNSIGEYWGLGNTGYWWTSTDMEGQAFTMEIYSSHGMHQAIIYSLSINSGFSVRCIRAF